MVASASATEPLELAGYPVTLDPADPARTGFGALEWRGGLELRSGNTHFGGLSALEFPYGDGRFIALSDLGYRVDGRLVETGRASIEIVDAAIAPLRDRAGNALKAQWRDAEAIAYDGADGFYAAFEGHHRLLRYRLPPDESAAKPVSSPSAIDALPKNAGVEALTRLCDGRLLLIAEGNDSAPQTIAWVGKPGGPALSFPYPISDGFLPTGATTLPDCRIALLERRFSLLGGFASRIRLLAALPETEGVALTPMTLAQFEAPLSTENFEGIAARSNDAGETLLYILSDDNFIGLQRTLLLVFAIAKDG